MTNEERVSPRIAMGAFLLGGLAGAAVALLVAPADGKTTRRRLTRKARETRQQAVRLAESSREAVTRQRKRLAEAATEGRKHMAEAGTHVAEAAREGRAAIRDIVRDVAVRTGRAGH